MIIKPKIIGSATPTTGDVTVRFAYLDIEDGKLVNKVVERYCGVGGSVTAPTISASLSAVTKQSCALTLDNWNITTLTNLQNDLDIGAIYYPTDNKTHAFISVNAVTGLSPSFYFNKSDTSTLTISWGDGTSDYTTSSSGNLNTSHTYSTAGTYEITIWISSGTGTYSFGNGTNSTVFVGGSTQSYISTLNSVFIGNNVTSLSDYAFYNSRNLKGISFTTNITSVGVSTFENCYSLDIIAIPSSIITLSNLSFKNCTGLYFVSMTNNVTTVGDYSFNFNYGLDKIVLSNGLTSINQYAFQYCYHLQKVILPNSITTLGRGCFNSCSSLKNISLPNSFTTFGGSDVFSSCYALKNMNIPSGVTSLGALSIFATCYSITNYTLNRWESPSTITTLASTGIFSNISSQCRIYVPVGSLAVYQAATNWSTYANYMYEDTPENRALFGD